MRGVLAVDEAFCLSSHYPGDSQCHAPRTCGISRRGAGPRAGGEARAGGGGGGEGRVTLLHPDALPASNAGVGVALVGSAASRSGAGAGGGTSSVDETRPARRSPGRARLAVRGGSGAQRGRDRPRPRAAGRRPGTRSCPGSGCVNDVTVRLKISMR